MENLRITQYPDGTLHLEHGMFDKGEVSRRSELDPSNDYNENALEDMGYYDIEKMYQGQHIEGLKERGEKLYIVMKSQWIPF